MQDFEMTTGQKVKIGVTVFDKGKPPVPYTDIPDGSTIVFESDNPAVASIQPIPDDPFNVYVRSPGKGTSTITVFGTGVFANLPHDTGTATVKNAEPGGFNTTVGAPEDETDEDP